LPKSSVSAARGKAGKSNKGNGKPDKPYPEFPLASHRSCHWCKKIQAKIHYFGAWGKRVGGKLVWIDGEGNRKPALEKYCGFGNGDCGSLPQSALDLKSGWIDFPRPKTAIERRCPLWPETIEAIQQAIEVRPKAKDEADAGLVFITKYGDSWAKNSSSNPISAEFRKLLQRPRCPKCNTLRTAKAEERSSKTDSPAARLERCHPSATCTSSSPVTTAVTRECPSALAPADRSGDSSAI